MSLLGLLGRGFFNSGSVPVSSSSLSAAPRVDVRAHVGADGVVISVKMILPPPVGNIYDDTTQHFISSNNQVTLSQLFQNAWYDIWRGQSLPMRYHVPVTSATEVIIDPLLGNDETDPCL